MKSVVTRSATSIAIFGSRCSNAMLKASLPFTVHRDRVAHALDRVDQRLLAERAVGVELARHHLEPGAALDLLPQRLQPARDPLGAHLRHEVARASCSGATRISVEEL